MSTTEIIYQKYWNALVGVEAVLVPQDTAIALALRLAIDDAVAVGQSMTGHEAAVARVSLERKQSLLLDLQATIDSLTEERDGLRRQITQLDVDNADLTQRLSNLAFNSVAHSNGNGTDVDPTAPTPVAWGRACPAWDGMTDEEREAVYDLASGRVKFGELSMELRTEILTRVLRYTMDGAERLTMAQFDNRKPDWMPIASGLVRVFGGQWLKMLDLAATPA